MIFEFFTINFFFTHFLKKINLNVSYKTNPILNRIKINKGWKNPSFPTKTLNSTRDFALWFKVYLLLKTFLNLKGIQLLSCEIRFDQQNKKLLYLLINKEWTKKKEKIKKKKLVKRIQTPIWKIQNQKAIFLLYKDPFFFKNLSVWKQNFVQQKVLSKSWLAKPKNSTWLNTLKKVALARQEMQKLKRPSNKQFFYRKQAKLQFYTQKQKQILASLARIKKTNSFLYLKLFQSTQPQSSQVLQKFTESLQKKIQTNNLSLKKMYTFYKFLSLTSQSFVKKSTSQIQKEKVTLAKIKKIKWKLFFKNFQQKIKSFHRRRLFTKRLPNVSLLVEDNFFPEIHDYSWNLTEHTFFLQKLMSLNFLSGQLGQTNSLLQNYFLLCYWKAKTHLNGRKNAGKPNLVLGKDFFLKNFFRTKFAQMTSKTLTQNSFFKLLVWRELRWRQKREKRKLFSRRTKKKTRKKTTLLPKYNFFWKNTKFLAEPNQVFAAQKIRTINKFWKKNKIAKYYQYRIPYRKAYFNFLRLTTNFHLKFLIQDLIKKYFFLQVEAKISHALNEYKNKKYFRLVFPIFKKEKSQLIQKFRRKSWKQKQIFLSTSLKFLTSTRSQGHENDFLSNKVVPVQGKHLGKKTFPLLTKKKRKQRQIQSEFSRVKYSKDFRQSLKFFVPAFLEFTRTFEPQILADVFAKVLKRAKNQAYILSSFKQILLCLNLPQNVGYKVALAGRINSQKKSRVIYFTRKNNPLQVFKKNMNFAYAQASARIGTFGVKIWIYF